jgi:hydrogenase maturation protease
LILGLGNVLMRDEGVGAHVARYLTETVEYDQDLLPPKTHAVDGGTLGLELLPLIHEARAVVFIDAVDFGLKPGRIRVLQTPELGGGFAAGLSVHEVGTADLLAVGRLTGSLPSRVALVGIQPGAIEVGIEMTPEVRVAVPVAACAARRQARALALLDGVEHA